MSESTTGMNKDVKTLGEKIKGVRFAMLTTMSPEGKLKSRPMTTMDMEFDGDLWFFVGLDAEQVSEIRGNKNVNLAYAKPDDNLFVSVAGQAEIVNDAAKKKELWNPLYKAWFPKGLEDPNLGLIKVNVQSAEYWDSPSGIVVVLAGFAKALITGKRDKNASENEELELAGK